MTSSIFPPRSDLAPCSPITQASASTTLDLPEPLGPTTQVIPGSSRRVVADAKDLKPRSVRLFKYTDGSPWCAAVLRYCCDCGVCWDGCDGGVACRAPGDGTTAHSVRALRWGRPVGSAYRRRLPGPGHHARPGPHLARDPLRLTAPWGSTDMPPCPPHVG